MTRVMPSTNPSAEDKLIKYIKELQQIGVDFIHCDVMDGKFVEAKCLPIELIREIKDNSLLNLDIHLMIENPLKTLIDYCMLRPSYITLHYEAFENSKDLIKAIEIIKSYKILVGLSIKPGTEINKISCYLPLIDMVLIMSVEPGKSGQKFMPLALNKIKELKRLIDKNRFKIKIEVDGGINEENAKAVVFNGANYLVMGSAFYNSKNRKKLLKQIQDL